MYNNKVEIAEYVPKEIFRVKCLVQKDTILLDDIFVNFIENRFESSNGEVLNFCKYEECDTLKKVSFLVNDFTNEIKYPYPNIYSVESVKAKEFFIHNGCSPIFTSGITVFNLMDVDLSGTYVFRKSDDKFITFSKTDLTLVLVSP